MCSDSEASGGERFSKLLCSFNFCLLLKASGVQKVRVLCRRLHYHCREAKQSSHLNKQRRATNWKRFRMAADAGDAFMQRIDHGRSHIRYL